MLSISLWSHISPRIKLRVLTIACTAYTTWPQYLSTLFLIFFSSFTSLTTLNFLLFLSNAKHAPTALVPAFLLPGCFSPRSPCSFPSHLLQGFTEISFSKQGLSAHFILNHSHLLFCHFPFLSSALFFLHSTYYHLFLFFYYIDCLSASLCKLH